MILGPLINVNKFQVPDKTITDRVCFPTHQRAPAIKNQKSSITRLQDNSRLKIALNPFVKRQIRRRYLNRIACPIRHIKKSRIGINVNRPIDWNDL